MKYSTQLILHVVCLFVCHVGQVRKTLVFFSERIGIEKTAEILHNIYSGLLAIACE